MGKKLVYLSLCRINEYTFLTLLNWRCKIVLCQIHSGVSDISHWKIMFGILTHLLRSTYRPKSQMWLYYFNFSFSSLHNFQSNAAAHEIFWGKKLRQCKISVVALTKLIALGQFGCQFLSIELFSCKKSNFLTVKTHFQQMSFYFHQIIRVLWSYLYCYHCITH